MTNVLYITSFACYGINEIGMPARNVGHAAVFQFGNVARDFPCFVNEGAVSAFSCIAETETTLTRGLTHDVW